MTDTPIFETLRLEYLERDVNILAIQARPSWTYQDALRRVTRIIKKSPKKGHAQ